jgi:DNA-binding transcriptional LysR family regulator
MHKLRLLLPALRVFDAVFRTGSVTRAAESLHVTPGAVSQQLKSLEAALGVLFYKEGRELRLSQAGQKLAFRISDSFDRIDNALTEFVESAQSKRLRLKAPPSLAIRWLLPRLPNFYIHHSDIEISLSTPADPADQSLSETDLGIRYGTGDWDDVLFDHLFDDAFIPVCTPTMAARIREARDFFDVPRLHSLMRMDAWGLWFESVGLHGMEPPRGLALPNVAICYQAALDGMGVAMAQRAHVVEDLRSGRLVAPVDHVATTEKGYYLVCDPLTAERPSIQVFRSWIRTMR